MYWILAVLCLLIILLFAFTIIARKGRELRTSQPLPPAATKGYLRWEENGKTIEVEIQTPFYLGRKPDSNVVLSNARVDYEACVFYHNQRFAFQSLDGAGIILINEEERPAGYLRDGDIIQIAGRKFTFLCH